MASLAAACIAISSAGTASAVTTMFDLGSDGGGNGGASLPQTGWTNLEIVTDTVGTASVTSVSGITLDLTVNGANTEFVTRNRAPEVNVGGSVTLNDVYMDFFLRVGTVELSGLVAGQAYDVDFLVWDDNQGGIVTQTITHTTGTVGGTMGGPLIYGHGQVGGDTLASDTDSRISGTSLVADGTGKLTFSFAATGSNTNALLNGVTITALDVPVITSAGIASGTVGQPFSYQITASSSPTVYGATGLPPGLSVDTSTGLVSGMPTATAVGVSNVTLSATNGAGPGTAPLAITVGWPVFLAFPLDTDPGWTRQGEWAFGTPTGAGGFDDGNPDPSAGATGTEVFGVNLSGDYSEAISGPNYLTAGPFDFSGRTSTALRFQRWLNTDIHTDIDTDIDYVFATIEVSANGTTWIPVWANGASEITDSAWTQVQYDISAVANNQSTVYVRWGYQVFDNAFAYSGWNIDDVEFSGSSPYIAWSGGAAADIDSNGDGIDNGVAWALGAVGPSANAIGLLPTLDNASDSVYAIFNFNRSDAANDDLNTTITVEYGNDLDGWTTAMDDGNNVIITVTPGTPTDAVQVKLKRSVLGAGGKLFARLKVVVGP